ncbi:MAG: RNA-directed DNA polymerase [Ruminiclostridium sp.]|nr:RNA-directed DNA polymerase [Ruminiclostridium sp.]
MIVYREFSSLTEDLGFSGKALYSLSNKIHRHYKKVEIPKADGSVRSLSVPDDFLKAVQRRIADRLLSMEEISPYAIAYRPGGSPLKNARPHIAKNTVLKLDITCFFDHITYFLVKEKAFPKERYSERNRILLTMLCIYNDALPQGAPTSPVISNIIMKDFDNAVGRWCRERRIVYTRYCDDMTFSGDFDVCEVKNFVSGELRRMGFFLNSKKTTAVRRGQRHTVTGIVVNEKPSISANYKAKLRQELYYIMKFGINSHLEKCGIDIPAEKYLQKLLGRANYILSVEPDNKKVKEYKGWLTAQLKK